MSGSLFAVECVSDGELAHPILEKLPDAVDRQRSAL
jgi:hypothetical protein